MSTRRSDFRAIRAVYSETSITVYQAFSAAIADAALSAGRFVAPFKGDRMTWIKPSFLWMMYRSGWATKPGQERVLAVEISRLGFEWALGHSALSHFEPEIHGTHEAWEQLRDSSPVRIQWDPERDIHLEELPIRSIQIGLGGSAIAQYADDWTIAIRDVTDLAHSINELEVSGADERAIGRLPSEREYPIPPELAWRIGSTVHY
jgi:uncharacterized protein DUF4291